MKKLQDQAQKLVGDIEQLKKDKKNLDQDKKKKDMEIAELQKTVAKEEKQKNQVETKLRFVNEQMIPKEQQISDLTKHLSDAGKEFVQKLKIEQTREKQVEALKTAILHQQDAIKKITLEKESRDKYSASGGSPSVGFSASTGNILTHWRFFVVIRFYLPCTSF